MMHTINYDVQKWVRKWLCIYIFALRISFMEGTIRTLYINPVEIHIIYTRIYNTVQERE